MKRLTLVAAALATVATLGLGHAAQADEAREAPAALTAAEPVASAEADASVVEPAPSFFEESTAATCEDFGFFAADKKGECDKSCKKGKTCTKKQVCGDSQCPPPGYCWKCPN